MARGMPSMVALLGLLAMAGYQNREKLAEVIRGMGQNRERLPGEGGRQNEGPGGSLRRSRRPSRRCFDRQRLERRTW